MLSNIGTNMMALGLSVAKYPESNNMGISRTDLKIPRVEPAVARLLD